MHFKFILLRVFDRHNAFTFLESFGQTRDIPVFYSNQKNIKSMMLLRIFCWFLLLTDLYIHLHMNNICILLVIIKFDPN